MGKMDKSGIQVMVLSPSELGTELLFSAFSPTEVLYLRLK